MKLSIIIPVYNEQLCVEAFWKHLKKAPIDKCEDIDDVEILIIDDGSTDGTREIMERLSSEPYQFDCGQNASVQFLPQDQNRGKGNAVHIGINKSTGGIVLVQDADLEYSPSDYPKMLKPITDELADAVFGSRFTGDSRRVLYFWHSIMNGMLTTLSNMFNDLNLTDMETGYKAVEGDLIRSLVLKTKRFGFEPELTSRLAHANVRIYEVPIKYMGRTYMEGKKIGIRDGIAALWHIFKFGIIDTEPFKPGLRQTLNGLNKFNSIFYLPHMESALHFIGNKDPQARILEVGSGIGSLTGGLLRRGSVVATDISREFIASLERKFYYAMKLETRIWDASSEPWEGAGKFDIVVAFNILEHIEDDVATLKNWRSMLKPNGSLIILVPNHKALFSPIDKAVGHFRRYNNSELQEKLRATGFSVRRVTYSNPLGILGWIVNGLILRRSTLSSKQLTLYRMLKIFIWPVERLAQKFTGLSLLIVARNEGQDS